MRTQSSPLLKKLAGSFKCEVCMLYVVAAGTPVFLINGSAGLVIAGVIAVLVIFLDTIFSVLITSFFLRPINNFLEEGRDFASGFEEYKNFQKTKWLSLAGCTLAVGSSTAMYFNFVLYALFQGSFLSNPWLYPYVFSIPLDSILNDLGMLLVCGVLKNVPSLSILFSRLFSMTTGGLRKRATVQAEGDMVHSEDE